MVWLPDRRRLSTFADHLWALLLIPNNRVSWSVNRVGGTVAFFVPTVAGTFSVPLLTPLYGARPRATPNHSTHSKTESPGQSGAQGTKGQTGLECKAPTRARARA